MLNTYGAMYIEDLQGSLGIVSYATRHIPACVWELPKISTQFSPRMIDDEPIQQLTWCLREGANG